MNILQQGELTEENLDGMCRFITDHGDPAVYVCSEVEYLTHWWYGTHDDKPTVYVGTPESFALWQKVLVQ